MLPVPAMGLHAKGASAHKRATTLFCHAGQQSQVNKCDDAEREAVDIGGKARGSRARIY